MTPLHAPPSPGTEISAYPGKEIIDVIFAKSPVAISVSFSSDGRIVNVNDRWTQLTGYARDEVIGKTAQEVGMWPSPAEREQARQAALKLRSGKSTELPFVTKDGRQILIRIEGADVQIGDQSYFVVYVSDVTQERQVLQAVEASERVAQQANDELTAQVELFRVTETVAKVGHWTNVQGSADLRWSPGLFDLTGVAHGTPMNSALARSLIHPEDLQIFVDARMRMDGDLLEYRAIMTDGSMHYMRSRMGRHVRSDGTVVDFGVLQDFTEEQKAKLALQDQLGQLQLLTNRLPEMVFQFAMYTPTSGAFAFVSEAVRTIFGVSPEQVYSNPDAIFRWVVPSDRPELIASMNTCAINGTVWSHEFHIRAADGRTRTLFGNAVVRRESSGELFAFGSVADISDHKASQTHLRESEERFRALTQLSSDWYWEQDENFRYVRFDGQLAPESGKSGFQSIGKTPWEVGALNMSDADWATHRAVLESGAVFRDLELSESDEQGQPCWMSISGSPMFDAQGQLRGYRGIGKNITERKRNEAKIERLAFYDMLTGLPNRRLLMDRLHYALATSGRDKARGALLFIDLDNFKDLNDTQGHDVGDMLLLQVAQRLTACVREADTVVRLGGDEFVVMLQNLDGALDQATAQVELVGKKILASLNQVYRLGALEHHSTPSIGIVLFVDQHQSVDDLLKQADLAMYESKSAGRNTMRFFDPAMQALVAQRTEIEAELRLGLQRGELLLHYQPVVDVESRVVGVEALVRWLHPRRGLVPPNAFISVAEQTGLILPLGSWVLDAACKQLAEWSHQNATAALTIAVNVSARQFHHPEFVEQVMETVRRTGANPQRLKLELTESLLLGDTQDAVRKMVELRQQGVAFSLDDFGTGYSSLSYLKILPLEQLKIDQSFVRDVLTDPNDAALARTILALGQSLGLVVVAEGVETAGQRDFLLQSGCTLFQGYLYSKPVPVEQLLLDDPAAHI